MTARPLGWGQSYLVCEPVGFTVAYAINPYMRLDDPPDAVRARAQWDALIGTLHRLGGATHVATAAPGLPDMAFAMNSGFVHRGIAVPSRFRFVERRGEEPHWAAWFRAHGLDVRPLDVPESVRFEAGDVFATSRSAEVVVAGYGFRTDREAIVRLGEALAVRAVPLELVDPRYYHLDVALCPLQDGAAMLYAPALSPASVAALHELFPDLVELTDDEASAFSANSVVVGHTVVMPACSSRLEAELLARGFAVERVDVGEFHKGGGSVRCLTMPLDVGTG